MFQFCLVVLGGSTLGCAWDRAVQGSEPGFLHLPVCVALQSLPRPWSGALLLVLALRDVSQAGIAQGPPQNSQSGG